MTTMRQSDYHVTKREFLKRSGYIIAGLSVRASHASAAIKPNPVKFSFGIVTDPHYADTASRGHRFYSESAVEMQECITFMNDKQVDFLIELGDFKDQCSPVSEQSTLTQLETIETIFKQFKGPRYHVLGNHDADSISKEQFLARVENTGIAQNANYYSFDSHGVHFVVLDANVRADGLDYDHGNFDWTDANIPCKQQDWLKKELVSTSKPVVVFIHQQLDGEDNHCVKNAAEIRQLLQASKRVLAVFQGHNHAGHYSLIDQIHYYTLKAMIEGTGLQNSAYAIVEVHDTLDLTVTGYRRATSKKMPSA